MFGKKKSEMFDFFSQIIIHLKKYLSKHKYLLSASPK